jgi:hypothetical protein
LDSFSDIQYIRNIVDGKYFGLSFFSIVGNMISEFEWKRINKLDFGGKFKYNIEEDKIPPDIMTYLEDLILFSLV